MAYMVAVYGSYLFETSNMQLSQNNLPFDQRLIEA